MIIRKKKRQALTLLEVIVALFLAGIVLSSLWKIYHNWIKSYQTMQKLEMETTKLFFVKQRLEKLFALVSTQNEAQLLFTPISKEVPHPALFAGYEGAPDPSPAFNGPLHSLLYLDDKKNFCLATWSKEQECRIEILQEQVNAVEFSFFNSQTNAWQKEWGKDLKAPPLFVEILIEIKGEKERFVFKIARPKEPILFLE